MTARALLPVNPDGGQEPSGGGAQGPPGQGVPTGGTTGQGLAKTSNSNYATGWTSFATALDLGTVANEIADLAAGTFTPGIYDPATRQAALEGIFTAFGQNPADHAAGIGQMVGQLNAVLPGTPVSESDFVSAVALWLTVLSVLKILGDEGVAVLAASLDTTQNNLATNTANLQTQIDNLGDVDTTMQNEVDGIVSDLADGTGRAFRLETVPTGAFTVGSTQSITVTWATPMPDATYAVQVADLGAALVGNVTVAVTGQTAATATVLVTSSAIIGVSTITLAGIQ